jgi:hypothetical protein
MKAGEVHDEKCVSLPNQHGSIPAGDTKNNKWDFLS